MAKGPEAPHAHRNAILSQMSSEVLERLSPHLLAFDVNLILYEPNAPIEYVYFPEDGVVSVVAVMENGSSIEVGTIGREGMVGSILLLKTETVPYRYFIQVAGRGYRVGAERFCRAATSSDELQNAALRYEAAFRTQTMQGMACNGLHSVEQRCCRWLLMSRDRVDSDDLKLTHEFLALMLGVRRSSVSEVLAPLKEMGLVRSHRGMISILNRKALEARVCECYRIMVGQEYGA